MSALGACATVPSTPRITGVPNHASIVLPRPVCTTLANARRDVRLRCEAANAHSVPQWRIYGAREDQLVFFDESQIVVLEVPSEWHLFELRAADASGLVWRVLTWIRARGGRVESRPYGSEFRP